MHLSTTLGRIGRIDRIARLATLLIATTCLTPAAHAAWLDGLLGNSPATTANADTDTRKVWPIDDFSFVRLVPSGNDAAPNLPQAEVSETLLVQLLSSVKLPKGKGTEPLFSVAEAWRLAPALREALASASPQEDVLLQSSARRAENSLEAPSVITARLYVTAEGLQLVVQATRFDYYDRWRGTGKTPDFPPATRQPTGTTPLNSLLAKNQAPSWLVFPLSRDLKAATLAPPPVQPKATTAPAVASPRDASFFNEQAQRLDGLKSLRDKNLITEAEYQQKRAEVLQGL